MKKVILKLKPPANYYDLRNLSIINTIEIKQKNISQIKIYINRKESVVGKLFSIKRSEINSETELKDQNVVKVVVEKKMSPGMFTKALDFVRSKNNQENQVYHHVGIYAFTNKALLRYVSLKRSKLELERRLEQLRAMENNMSIHVGYINSSPLSVDTEKDFLKIKKLMGKNE